MTRPELDAQLELCRRNVTNEWSFLHVLGLNTPTGSRDRLILDAAEFALEMARRLLDMLLEDE
jgi:hypothetical protein